MECSAAPTRSSRTLLFASLAMLLLLALLAAPGGAWASTVPGYLVNTIHTSQWDTPSPDPMGIAYSPSSGNLFVVDGDVDEIPALYQGANIFESTRSGNLIRAFDLGIGEPAGISFAVGSSDVFIADDQKQRIYQINQGPDGIFGTEDDAGRYFPTVGFATDPEGVTYGAGKLFIASGVDRKVFILDPGPNGVFDGGGDDIITHFDTAPLGVGDPEGVAFWPARNSLLVIGTVRDLVEVSLGGQFLRRIDLSTVPAVNSSDVTVAPGSTNPSVNNLYITDRGLDNGSGLDPNDGRIYEVTLDRSWLPVDFELLGNPGFELDNNVNGAPDIWRQTKNDKFFRTHEYKRSGSYAGKIIAANAGVSEGQFVKFLTPGTPYAVSGWVNIPVSDDPKYTLTISVIWLDGTGATISSEEVKVHSHLTGATNGWEQFQRELTAPPGTATARLQLTGDNIGLAIYVDDFSFKQASGSGNPVTNRSVGPGWNLLAGGPGSNTGGVTLFGFTGTSYASTTAANMQAGKGYWGRFSSAGTASLTTVPAPLGVQLTPGWNLIGNATPGQVRVPTGKTAFVFNGTSYASRATLEPGEGAWIRVTTGETIQLAP
jgi:uncharacterized protein YjiK